MPRQSTQNITRDKYLGAKRFIDAVRASGIDPIAYTNDSDALYKKRELLRTVLPRGYLRAWGGEPITLEQCEPKRISSALREKFERAERTVDQYEQLNLGVVVERVNALLSLDAIAEREFAPYRAQMPLFGQDKFLAALRARDAAQSDIKKYLAGLTSDVQEYVKTQFGDRVKQYL